MPREFQVGDIVRIRAEPAHYFVHNSTGTIRYISNSENMPYAVELLQGSLRSEANGHSCGGCLPSDNGQWLARLHMTLIRPVTTANEPEEPEETDEAEARETCERCDEETDNCTCVPCGNCERIIDNGCECTECTECNARFAEDSRGCCTVCRYCGPCIRNGRVDHYTCPGCDSCRSEDSRSCDNCGEHECCTTFPCRNDDCYRCSNCCNCRNNDRSGYIRDYSCRDYPDAKPSPKTVKPNFLYLGVEVETETEDDGTDLTSIAETMHEEHSHEILMKEDGSLEHGIELVTGRYSLEAHQEMWPRVCKTALESGLRSWKHSSTGLHVHMSRAFFTPLDIGKVLVFINSDNTAIRTHIKRLAGRGANHYCKIHKKKLTDCRPENEDRYEAVNLTNTRTIEVRIFKGTLNAKHVLADIEFCHAMANWVKETSTQDIESWHSFWTYTLRHKKLYKNLIEFLCPTQPTLPNIEPEDKEEREENT